MIRADPETFQRINSKKSWAEEQLVPRLDHWTVKNQYVQGQGVSRNCGRRHDNEKRRNKNKGEPRT